MSLTARAYSARFKRWNGREPGLGRTNAARSMRDSSAVASAVSRIRLINGATLVVMGTLVLFWLWGRATGVGTAIGLSFYVYIGIVNVFLIAQFWSFANDIYTESEGKRLFAVIAIGVAVYFAHRTTLTAPASTTPVPPASRAPMMPTSGSP